jgi:hypothetical protein
MTRKSIGLTGLCVFVQPAAVTSAAAQPPANWRGYLVEFAPQLFQ